MGMAAIYVLPIALVVALGPNVPFAVRSLRVWPIVRSRSTIAQWLTLSLSKPKLFTDNWIYIDEPSVKVGRIENFRTWSPELVPDQRLSCLGLECFCFEDDGVWTMDEDLSDQKRSSSDRFSDITSSPVGIPQQT